MVLIQHSLLLGPTLRALQNKYFYYYHKPKSVKIIFVDNGETEAQKDELGQGCPHSDAL